MSDKNLLLKKKKQLLTYVTAATIGVSALTGCGNQGFNYQKDKDGKIEKITGELDYDSFKNLKFIHLTNDIANIDEYILADQEVYYAAYSPSSEDYIDITNGNVVYDSDNDDYSNFNMDVIVDHMVNYLYKYDMIKDLYTIDDATKLKENLLNDPDLNIKQKANKRLVK